MRASRLPSTRTAGLFAVLTLAGLAPTADAAVVLSNLDQPRRSASTIQATPDDVVTLPWASQSFVTDAQAYRVDSLEVVLGARVDAPTVVAELRADAGGSAPGALIATLTLGGAVIPTGSPAILALTPTATVDLAAGTTYWLVLGALDAGSYDWEYAEGNGSTGPGAFGNFAYSFDQGASWTGFGGDNPFKLAVNASPVPVPSVAVLFGIAVGGLWARRRA
ncbi:MAG: choice-of-anchor R domain-containing protein [Gammaproteobacteria bacterium]